MTQPVLLLGLLLLPCSQDLAPPAWGERIEWASGSGPQAREHAVFVGDPTRNRAILLTGSGYAPYGSPLGDAWALDLASDTWGELGLTGELPAGGSRRAGATAGGIFLHGGYGAGMAPDDGLWHVDLEDDHVIVRRVPQEDAPPARALHAFACDAAGEHFVVFGGAAARELGDTWIGRGDADGVHWEELDGKLGPGPRFGFAFGVTAPADGAPPRLLVCGGQIPATGSEGTLPTVRDLWALDFAADAPHWELVAEYDADEFPGRRNPAFALDPRSGDLLVWGGTGNGTSALSDLHVVRTRVDGAPVERIRQPERIPTRASGFGVVDRPRARALLGFGNTAAGGFEDLVVVHLRAPGTASER